MDKLVITGSEKTLGKLVRYIGRFRGVTIEDESGTIITKNVKNAHALTNDGNADLQSVEEVKEEEKLETESVSDTVKENKTKNKSKK
jgi:hypothetical protein